MNKKILWILLLSVLPCALQAVPRVKVLDWSWSNPTLEYLEANLQRMNQECPLLDGLVLRVAGKVQETDGKKWTPGLGNVWNRLPWKYEYFEEAIARFRKLDFGHFTDNFFYLTTSHVDFDWASDADWAIVAENFGVAAKVSKAIGLKGLGLDIEEYGKRFWRKADLNTDYDIHALSEIAFKRGQEAGHAMFREFPEIVIFMPFCLTMGSADLSLPFMNGVIDVMPPTALIYEGHETQGYQAKFPAAYAGMQNSLRHLIRDRILPQNTRKARAQVLYAPAFYLDAYFVHGEKSNWRAALEPQRTELTPVRMFARNFAAAGLEADPYIWVYGEERCWWKGSWHPRVLGTWDEAPEGKGLMQALMEVKNPAGTQAERPGNLLKNYRFQETGAWPLWQREDDQKKPAPGDGKVGNGLAVMHKVSDGCFHQNLPIKAGQTYFFLCRGGARNPRSGVVTASIHFQDANRRWLFSGNSVQLSFKGTGEMETVWAFLTAPAEAAFASVQCGARSQSEGGEAFFSEILLEER